MVDVLGAIAIALITFVALGIALGGKSRGWQSKRERKERHEEAQGCFYIGVMVVFLLMSFPYWRHGWVKLGASQAWSWVIAIFGLLVIATVVFLVIGSQFMLVRWWSKLLSWAILILVMVCWALVTVGTERLPEFFLEWGTGVIQRL